MNHWQPQRELHANTRRTRLTLFGYWQDEPAVAKCYRAPCFGLFHWYRTHRKGLQIRVRGIPTPAILNSGWRHEERCFCILYQYLGDHQALKDALMAADPHHRTVLLDRLVALLASCHRSGLIQGDANLTNFLVGPDGALTLIDEDDIRLCRGPAKEAEALDNLAAAAIRIPNLENGDIEQLWHHYREADGIASPESLPIFQERLAFWHQRLLAKGKFRHRSAAPSQD